MKKIAHLTSVHPRYDTRIFVKMCSSLAQAGYDTALVVADDQGDEHHQGVRIIDVGRSKGGRISRIRKTVDRVYQKAVELDASIYHLHDPELIPIGLKLKKHGKTVIFDAHEDFPKQIFHKPYLNVVMKHALSHLAAVYEKYACKKFDAVITATTDIRDKFLKINSNSVDIANYPLLDELAATASWDDKGNEIAYVGGISEVRGIKELVRALAQTSGVRLNLGGRFTESDFETEVKGYPSWSQVNELGYLDRQEVANVMAASRVGMVTLWPSPNHLTSMPVKMFEYMSAGIPVIASDFPLWKEIVEGHQCGICVDPLNIGEISEAINNLINNPDKAEQMGANGRDAVLNTFNWPSENRKLIQLYQDLGAAAGFPATS